MLKSLLHPGRAAACGVLLLAGLLSAGTVAAQNFPPTLANTVNVTAPDSTVVSATDTDTLVDSADLAVTKTVDDPAPAVGSNVTFTVTATNNGPAPALAVVVSDPLPAPGYTLVSGTPSVGTYDSGTGAWTVGTLANGGTATLTLVATVNATGPYANTATGSSTTPDPTPGNNTQTSTPVPVFPQLTITKTASAASFTVGTAASYTLSVQNTGTAATTAASTITDTIPTGLTIGTLPAGCTASGQVVTCTIGSGLAVSATTNFIIPVTPTVAAGASVTNTATVSGGGDPTCPAAARCTSSIGPTPVTGTPALTVDKAAGTPSGTTAGSTIDYTFLVTNTGNVTITGIAVNDPQLDAAAVCPVTTLAPGASTTCTGTHTITQAEVDAGVVNNSATTSGTPPVGGPTTSPPDTTSTPITAGPVLTINKTAGTPTYSVVGQVIDYEYVVTNTGNVTVTSINVGDDRIPTVTCPVATLLPGVSMTCTASYTILASDLIGSPGTVTNIATATGTPAGGALAPAVDTVTITEAANPIVAVDDAGSVASGATGGTAVPNVLINDTLNGAPATLATVALSQVSTSNPNVTLDPATGQVTVAPGTAAGNYTVVYEICEILNPANCSTATVTVTVGAAPIVAVDDAGSVPSGATGGTAVPNVLINDTLNGAPATLATVALAQVSTSNPNVTLDPATGQVNVAPGTAAGNYTVVYEICEILNPANCSTATVIVTVGAAVIDAVDDAGGPVNGLTGATAVLNVFGNDTLNGAAVNSADVILAPVTNGPLTVNANGTVDVAPNTPAGTYTIDYTICEVLNPANCDTATVTITVVAAPILALDDAGTVTDGGVGGLAVPNVLVNDTLNGVPATLATVTITQLATSNPNVTLDPATGQVTVAPGVAAGTYTVNYRICEILNPANCSDAVVTVTVVNGDIAPIAVDDDFIGDEGAPIPGNASGNDTPGNISSTYTALAQPANGTVVMNPDGSFVYTPNPGFVGPDTFPYQVCDADGDCATAIVTITVSPIPGKLRIQKSVSLREVNAGSLVAYTLTVTNLGQLPVVAADVVDVPPSGFAFVPGSVTVVDTDNMAVTSGTGPITFAGIDIPVGGTATIRYLMRVGAGLLPGEYVNEATVFQFGVAVSNVASAAVVTGAGLDPDFEQTRIWGKVFDDRNGDGWQDEGERGIPGVRLATVEGLVSETDAQGRFHIEGLVVSNQMRGQNFVVKLDKSTLPDGAELTTANPLMRRITPAIPTRFDFGVRMPPSPAARGIVELELGSVVFATGSREIRPQYLPVLEQMAAQVREHDSGEVSIQTVSGDEALALDRAVQLRESLVALLGADAAAGLRIDVLDPDKTRLLSVGERLTVASVLFDTDRDTIRAESEALIDAIARAVVDSACGCSEIVLTGHADVRGNAAYNQDLALRRAQAVRQAVEARLTPEQRARVRVEMEGASAPGAGL